MATVTFDGVTKEFDGSFVALWDFSLEVADGEFVVFVGPSGCGKTTALRMVAGLEDGDQGTSSSARERQRRGARERDVAMVFQNYALYPHMTVYDNIAFGLRARRVPRSQIRRRVEQSGGRSASSRCSSASRGSSPAVSASASRWGAPSSATRACS